MGGVSSGGEAAQRRVRQVRHQRGEKAAGVEDSVLPMLKSVIEKAEGSEHRKKVEDWLQRLKDAYDDVEDALDLLNYHHLRCKVAAAAAAARSRSSHDMLSPKKIELRRMLNKLEKIAGDMLSPKKIKLRRRLNKLEKIAGEVEKLRDLLGAQAVADSRETISQPPPKVFGRDKDREEIIRHLKTEHAAAAAGIPIIAIVGRPGGGKTTLAQHVCEQLKSESGGNKHFDRIMWAYASCNFNISEIMINIIKQASIISGRHDSGNLDSNDTLEVLQTEMNKKLRAKKFLLVIEDVWCDTEEHEKDWKTLFGCLSKRFPGSKILVTSQTDDVPRKLAAAKCATVEYVHHLEELEEKDFLDLFIHYALPPGEEIDSSLRTDLEEKCKTIAKKLSKDPTAAEIVGKTVDRNFRTIEQGKSWSGDRTKALMWSYLHLPAHLQRCFSYCSLYPRDHKFKDSELVKLWMAQGFIKPDGQNERMEDVGNGYLNKLVSRFYIQSHECYYTLHELLYDLAEKVSSGVCLRFEGNHQGQIPPTIRHLCIPADKLNERKDEICQLKKLRTLIVTKGEREYVATDVFKSLKKLRVLVLELYLENLAEFISEMKHLRILRVSDTREFVLPESVCTLYQLQVLEAENASSLPKFLTNLVNLRYVQAKFDIILAIPDIGKLTSLQGLDNFQVRKEAGYKQEQQKTFHAPRAHMRVGNAAFSSSAASARAGHELEQLQNILAHSLAFFMDAASAIAGHVLEQLQNIHEYAVALMGAASAKAGHELEPLQNMNELGGRLRIANLENVESKESIIAAKLGEKKYLDALELAWSYGWVNVNSNLDVEILECLQLPPNLTSLSLDGYRGLSCPSWPQYQTGNNIQELALRRCGMLEELPLMDQIFPSCRSLELSHLPKIKALHALSPQLTTLIIENARSLTSLGGIGSLPHLKELYLSGCPSLDSETAFLPSSLEIITFASCADVDVILANADLPCLSDLTITRCHLRTESLQFGNLPSLRCLDISHCPGSFSLDLQELQHSLEILILHNCSNLKAVTNFPRSLTSLEIHGCPILEKQSINVDPHLSGVHMLGDIPIQHSFEDDL